MDGTTRPLVTLLLVSLSTTACSFTKSPEAKSVQLPEQPVGDVQTEQREDPLDVQFALARTFEQERDLDRAASLYRAILMQDSSHAGATHRLAIICDQQGRHEESRKLFQRALELRPGNADLYCDLGYSFYCQQQWAQAERNFRLALQASPAHERAHHHLGLTLAAQGKDDLALRELAKSGCSTAEARANLALMQTFTGRHDEAAANCELARKADPENEQVIARLNQVETVLSQADIAQPQPTPAPEVVVARKTPEPEPTPVWAVGFGQQKDSAGDGVRHVAAQEQEQEQEPAGDETVQQPVETPAKATRSVTGPLQRLLRWRRADEPVAKADDGAGK